MKIKHILIPMAATVMLTSCLDNDDNSFSQTFTNVYAGCFNAVRDNSDGTTTFTPAAKYTITFVTDASGATTAQISITNLRLPDVSLTSFDLPALNVKMPTTTDKPMTVTASDVVPTNVGGSTVVFDQFSFSFLNRYVKEGTMAVSAPVYAIRYMVNGKYTVTALPTQMIFFGTTETTAYADGSKFTTTAPRYAVTLDPDKKLATLDITGAQFLESMPGMDMTFGEIPFTLNNNTISFEKDALTPTSKGVPYPSFPITDFQGAIEILNRGSLRFNCDASKMGKFGVNVTLKDLSPLSELPKEQ